MITVDTEASKELIKAGKEVFERFGSTRLLAYGMLVMGVVMVLRSTDKPGAELLYAGLGASLVGFALLIIAYILRPHDSKPPKKKQEEAQS